MDDRQSAQRQARALGDPTRHAIFRYVKSAGRPVDVPELTKEFALNHNTIRQHLARLCDAGLVMESMAPARGRGRRRLEYQASPGAGAWGVSAYRHLSLLLLEIYRSKRTPREVGRRVGRNDAGSKTEDVADRLEELAARDGFDPRRVDRRQSVDFVLEHCPYEDAAAEDPAVVCELHRGIAEGVADALGRNMGDVELVARDPHRAGCRLRVTR